jgi:hypothetical protein
MTKKIWLLVFSFSLSVSILNLNASSVKAYEKADIIPQPDVLCDIDLGCLIDEWVEDETFNVTWYSQKLSSYTTIFMHTDYGMTHCSVSLYTGGCAVASMTMLLNYYRGYTSQTVVLTDVNDDVYNSCDYYYVNFENAYPNDVHSTYISNAWRSDKAAILDIVGSRTDSTHFNFRCQKK